MIASTFVYALATLPLAFAQYSYPVVSASASATNTVAGPGAVHTVSVGQNGLTFTPDTIHANVGEQITFQFFPKNHSVVQADFNNPCNPSGGGIFSGFVPTMARPSVWKTSGTIRSYGEANWK
jgi:plastocyanin